MAVGIALVGTGFALNVQLPAFRLIPGAEIRALVGRDPARTEALARRHGIARSSTQLEAVLSDAAIDLICISTPPDTHRTLALAALAAGKHVLCEKPMALDAGEAAVMTAAARAARGFALIDHQLRFAPSVVRLRRLIADGFVGTPLYAQWDLATPRWLDHSRPHSWWQERQRGGGALGAFGSHAVDLFRWLFGDIAAAAGVLRTFVPERAAAGELRPRAVDADDWAAFWLCTSGPHALQIVINLSAVAHRGEGFHVVIQGTEGALKLDTEMRLWGSRRDPSAPDAPFDLLSEPDPLAAEVRQILPDSPWALAFVHSARALVQAIEAGHEPPASAATFADGQAVQDVLDAVRQSHQSGAWVALPGY